MAVNQEYADPGAPLHGGDEVALIPPISGGAVGALHARVTTEPLTLDPLVELVRDPRAGAVVTFLGVTREVPELEYEAYAEMAERQMAEIVARAIERHGLCAAAVEHRVGTVPLSEASVAIAVSAPHRAGGVRGRAGDHRRDQGAGPDLEEGGGRMGARGRRRPAALRSLPAVHELAAALDAPHALAVAAARRAIEERRAAVLAGRPGDGDLVARARELLVELERPIAAARDQRHRGDPPHEPRAGAAAGRARARRWRGPPRATRTSSSTWRRASGAAATPTSSGCCAS